MSDVIYFGGDCHDIATQRRVAAMQELGHRVHGVAYRKSDANCTLGDGCFDLGEMANNRLFLRLLKLLFLLPRIILHLRKLPRAELIIARNLDMLLLASISKFFAQRQSRLVYECLDIHGVFTNGGITQTLARWVERRCLRRVDRLVVSSPAFVSEYFEKVHQFDGEWVLVENKIWLGPLARLRPSVRPLEGLRKIRLGWVGNIRCQSSFKLLMHLADTMQQDIEVHIYGQVHHHAIQYFDHHVAARFNVTFHGAYRYPDDLKTVYQHCDLVWAQDMWQRGANSDLLLPNRVYESGWFGCPSVAVAGTQTAHFIAEHGIGYCVAEPTLDAMKHLVESLDLTRLDKKRREILELNPNIFVQSSQDIEQMLTVNHAAGSLPDFLCIGAMRAGTTTLFHHCQNHPEIDVPALKETDFFVAEKHWGKGLDWYRSLFSKPAKCSGEFSPNYTKAMVFPDVPKRIFSVAPNMKFIFIARHPVDRAISQYQHSKLFVPTLPDMDTLIGSHEWHHLVDTSSYAKQLRHYFEYFSPDQFLVLDFQTLCDRPDDALALVAEFLQVSNTWAGANTSKLNSGSELSALPGWALWFAHSPIWHGVRGVIPLGLRRLCKQSLKQKHIRPVADFTPELKQQFWQEVRQDMQDFHDISGICYGAPLEQVREPRKVDPNARQSQPILRENMP